MGRGCIYGEKRKRHPGTFSISCTRVERQKMERFNNPEFTSY